jgi:phenylalanyl-tRNA synthetase alpha subunit
MEMILHMVNQNVQDTLKKFQDIKSKEYNNTQKQINELIGALNKHQSKTENTIINRVINELKIKIENIKEEVTHDIEKPQKKESNRNTKYNGSLEGACFLTPSFVRESFFSRSWLLLNLTGANWG